MTEVGPSRRRRWILAGVLIGGVAVASVVHAIDAWARAPIEGDWLADVRNAEPVAPEITAVADPQLIARFDRPEIWDLASSPRGLVVATAEEALGSDGASIFRVADDGTIEHALSWPGQGFCRVHAYGDRLVVPDADAPFRILEFALRWRIDGFVFVSDPHGGLERRHRTVLPDTYHIFDVARLSDGTLVAATGAYPEGDTAYLGRHAPAALLMATDEGWQRVLEWEPEAGVTRYTWLQPLGDALIAATTTPSGGPAAVRITGLPANPVQEPIDTLDGMILRWAVVGDTVFALSERGQGARLSRSVDGGRTFTPVADGIDGILGAGDALFALANGQLMRSTDGETFEDVGTPAPLARLPGWWLDVPMAAHGGHVWAGSPQTGELYRW